MPWVLAIWPIRCAGLISPLHLILELTASGVGADSEPWKPVPQFLRQHHCPGLMSRRHDADIDVRRRLERGGYVRRVRDGLVKENHPFEPDGKSRRWRISPRI